MTDTIVLKQILIGNNLTQAQAAKMLGISVQSFNMKINNKREFTVSEITKMIKIFRIKDPMAIFFCRCCRFKINSLTSLTEIKLNGGERGGKRANNNPLTSRA